MAQTALYRTYGPAEASRGARIGPSSRLELVWCEVANERTGANSPQPLLLETAWYLSRRSRRPQFCSMASSERPHVVLLLLSLALASACAGQLDHQGAIASCVERHSPVLVVVGSQRRTDGDGALVTVVSHATIERRSQLEALCQTWPGPLAAALLVARKRPAPGDAAGAGGTEAAAADEVGRTELAPPRNCWYPFWLVPKSSRSARPTRTAPGRQRHPALPPGQGRARCTLASRPGPPAGQLATRSPALPAWCMRPAHCTPATAAATPLGAARGPYALGQRPH